MFHLSLKKPPSLLQVISSVIAAMFGVQSENSRQRDFNTGNPFIFIVVGVIIALLFVGVLIGIVNYLV